MQDSRIAGRYQIGKKIGSGSFGEIFLGVDIQTRQEVAVKAEKINTSHPQLVYESKLIKLLAGTPGLPLVFWQGTEGSYNVMVMELLGPSLEELFTRCNRRLSVKTALMLADQLLLRIEAVHARNFVHRDIKPDNFLMGLEEKASMLYVIDFGLAKKYRDVKTNQHIPYREGKSLTGTARYASLNAHAGRELSRRDDLESIGYILMYFIRGSLPWQGITTKRKEEKYRKIFEKKSGTSVDELCRGYPDEFRVYINYCKALRFEEQPDYEYLRRGFKELFERSEFVSDLMFDWCLSPELRDTPKNDEEAKSISLTPAGTRERKGKGKKKRCDVF